MKKIIVGTLIGLLLVIISLTVGASASGVPHLVYVYSDSMEPLIKVNDAFIVVPSKKLKVGDVIMYRPTILRPDYVTHRIVAYKDEGFITKGDNSPFADQEGGEPVVKSERIVGKVLEFDGSPIVFRELGKFSTWVKETFGNNTQYVSGLLFLLAFLNVWMGRKSGSRHLKSRHRWRLGHIYKAIGYLAFLIVVISVYWGSRTTPISYLVSEYPTNLDEQVEVKQEGNLKIYVKNSGLIPVWNITEVEKPLNRELKAELIWPGVEKQIDVSVMPQENPGMYKGYVRIFNYPAVMPKALVNGLHRVDSNLAIVAVGAMVLLLFWLTIKLLDRIHGLESWIPLKGIKDKIVDRRMHRIAAKVFGRKRVRE